MFFRNISLAAALIAYLNPIAFSQTVFAVEGTAALDQNQQEKLSHIEIKP